jgi:DNA-binding GntR family transcriptional regulator
VCYGVVVQIKRYERRPLYQQIADDLRGQITEGHYPVGAQLPTLAELAQEYQVSDVTARKSLAWLERHGIIAIRHGKRSVVLEPEIDPSDSYGQLYAQIAELTRRMDSIVDRLDDLTATIHGHKQSTTSRVRRSS